MTKQKNYQHEFNYLREAIEGTSRPIRSLEMNDGPVKSVKQAQQLEAIGGNIPKQVEISTTFQ